MNKTTGRKDTPANLARIQRRQQRRLAQAVGKVQQIQSEIDRLGLANTEHKGIDLGKIQSAKLVVLRKQLAAAQEHARYFQNEVSQDT